MDTSDGRAHRRAAFATLTACALALAGVLAIALSQAHGGRLGTNNVVPSLVNTLRGSHLICQTQEVLPAGTGAVHLSLMRHAVTPALTLTVLSATTDASVAVGRNVRWDRAGARVALHPRPSRDLPARVCFRLRAPASAAIDLLGAPAGEMPSATDRGQETGGRIRIDYLATREQSDWALATTVVTRIGRGHAWSGRSVALVAALLLLSSILVAGWLLVRPS